jgi:phosphohistidine swiveling domain-containing protein
VVSIANNIGATLIDQRKRNVMICNSAFDALLSVIAKATGSTIENLHLLIPQELKYFIEEPESYKERFEERKNLFICLQSDFPLADELIEPVDISSPESVLSWKVTPTTEPFIAEGAVAAQALDKLNIRMNLYETASDIPEKLQGVAAFYNPNEITIEGVVRIIKNPKTETLNSGEILVAPSTTPDYIGAINKSKAIVTDWGGQTSHAAIVSRELKKPCMIGTGFASQLLKTGQLIKIDFAQGTIESIQ